MRPVSGKFLTCELPEAELHAPIRKKGLKEYTDHTISSPERLKEELGKVRREQLARDREEFIINDNCNAAPIKDSSGRIIAAISLSAFIDYMTVGEIESAVPAIVETAGKISYFMGFHSWQ